MAALTADTCTGLGIAVEPRPLSLYEQLRRAELLQRAAKLRMEASVLEIEAGRVSFLGGADLDATGVPAAISHFKADKSIALAHGERIAVLRGLIARAERLAGRLSYPPRPAAPELRAP